MVNDRDSASRRSLRSLGSDATVVTCIGGVTMELVLNEPGLLDLSRGCPQTWRAPGEADDRQVCAPAHMRSCGQWKSVCSLTQTWSTVPRWRRKTS